MHSMEVMQREKEHNQETDKLKLNSKISDISEEVSKKLMQKEMKLREEMQNKYAELEKVRYLKVMLCITMFSELFFQNWKPIF